MHIGYYYRCPVVLENADRKNPRFFVLAQLAEYNELSGAATVKMHDLLGTASYYGEIINQDKFYAPSLKRCQGLAGSVADCGDGTGRILECVPSSERDGPYWYYIELSNGVVIKKPETEIRLEYSHMNYSPYRQLLRYELQNPSWFLNRIKVSRNTHLIHHAAYGFEILAGCRAFLLPHQVSTIERCLETRPVRYMLADEVGLGKTVEACSILKILKSENPHMRTLIIVPEALMGQWENELRYKYQMNASHSISSSLCIFPMERLKGTHPAVLRAWDLVIVDETHRLLGNENSYQAVQWLSRTVPNILLLSATPIQDRNEEYRKLLALLSPGQYADMEETDFKNLVKRQKATQTVVTQQLNRLKRYDDYAEIIVEKLRDTAEKLGDDALCAMTDEIDLSADDRGAAKVRQTIAYICENYRVERRVIRNRRQAITENMAHRDLYELPYQPLTSDELYNETGVIQGVLAYLTSQSDGSFTFLSNCAIPLLGALFSSPWALEDTMCQLHVQDEGVLGSVSVWKRQAEQELNRVNEILDDPDLIQGRLLRVLYYIDEMLDLSGNPDCKVVVFTAYSGTLKAFMHLFQKRFTDIQAVAFCKGMAREELEDSVYQFQNNPDCRALICDETGGEGRNFQKAAQIIHLDLPWDANTLEQRIGRLDRLGRDPAHAVVSVVPYAERTIEEQLFRIWRDGVGLFSHSLSGLEIITRELNRQIGESLLDDFYNGLASAYQDILEQAQEMRESVEDEQIFDIGTTLYRPLAQGIDHILKLYAEDGNELFAQAMRGWSNQAGLGQGKPTGDHLLEFQEQSFSVGAARQSLFAPPDWSRYANAAILRREGKLIGSFDRRTAAQREDILFFAPGDPLYDAIVSNAMGCSRGRCCAMRVRGPFSYAGLLFLFQVKVPLAELLDQGISLRILQQYRMFLPLEPIFIPVGLTADSRKVPDRDIYNLLQSVPAYSAEHLGRRGGFMGGPSPLDTIKANISPNLMKDAYQKAKRDAKAEMNRQSQLMEAEREMERILNGLRAECRFLHRDDAHIQEKERAFSLTLDAMKRARPVLDACCFLEVRKNG